MKVSGFFMTYICYIILKYKKKFWIFNCNECNTATHLKKSKFDLFYQNRNNLFGLFFIKIMLPMLKIHAKYGYDELFLKHWRKTRVTVNIWHWYIFSLFCLFLYCHFDSWVIQFIHEYFETWSLYNHAQSIKIFMNTKTYSTLFIYPTISKKKTGCMSLSSCYVYDEMVTDIDQPFSRAWCSWCVQPPVYLWVRPNERSHGGML
jgi:hypothetical protein